MAMMVTNWSRGFALPTDGSPAIGVVSTGPKPLAMSLEKVTVTLPSSGSVGVAKSNGLVTTFALIAPASAAKLTGVAIPTRFPYRSESRTVQVVVSYSSVVVYTGRFVFEQRK